MTHELDITNEHCPMTFVKTKLQLEQIESGDVLEVLLTEGEPLQSVPRTSAEQGYEVLGVEHLQGTTYKVSIRK